MALGEQLRKARLGRNETASQVAAATQMTTQSVEDIEQENFIRLSAPIYAKGFIKLYAKHLGLDPQPLIQEYMARFANNPTRPTLLRGESERREANVHTPTPAIRKPEPVSAAPAAKPETRPTPPAATRLPPPPVEDMPPVEPFVNFSGIRSAAGDIARTAGTTLRQSWDSLRKGPRDIHENLRSHPWLQNRPTGSWLKYIPVVIGIFLILVFLVSSLSRLFAKQAKTDTRVPLNEKKQEIHLVIDPPAPYFQ